MSLHELTSVVQTKWLEDQNREADIVNFVIDGFMAKEYLIQQVEARGRITATSSLFAFDGLPRDVIASHVDAFLTGYSTHRAGGSVNLVPVLACECGSPFCGGVWTRVHVGRRNVNWSGFGFWNGLGPFSPNYDPMLRVFDGEAYEFIIRNIISQAS